MLHEAFNEDHRVFLVLRLNVTRNCGDLLRCHSPWIVLSYWMVLLAHDWISLTMVYWISFLSLTRCVLILKLWMYEFLMPSSIQTLSPWTRANLFLFLCFLFFQDGSKCVCLFLFIISWTFEAGLDAFTSCSFKKSPRMNVSWMAVCCFSSALLSILRL